MHPSPRTLFHLEKEPNLKKLNYTSSNDSKKTVHQATISNEISHAAQRSSMCFTRNIWEMERTLSSNKEIIKHCIHNRWRKTKEYNLIAILPFTPFANSPDLKHDMKTIKSKHTASHIYPTLLTEVLLKIDPDALHWKSKKPLNSK